MMMSLGEDHTTGTRPGGFTPQACVASNDLADLTPYKLTAAEIDLQAINDKLAYGAVRSMEMDFTEYDRIDDFELNEILYQR